MYFPTRLIHGYISVSAACQLISCDTVRSECWGRIFYGLVRPVCCAVAHDNLFLLASKNGSFIFSKHGRHSAEFDQARHTETLDAEVCMEWHNERSICHDPTILVRLWCIQDTKGLFYLTFWGRTQYLQHVVAWEYFSNIAAFAHIVMHWILISFTIVKWLGDLKRCHYWRRPCRPEAMKIMRSAINTGLPRSRVFKFPKAKSLLRAAIETMRQYKNYLWPNLLDSTFWTYNVIYSFAAWTYPASRYSGTLNMLCIYGLVIGTNLFP